jgi:hypothetical protein
MSAGGPCANCGSARDAVIGLGQTLTLQCPDCEWPVGVPVPDAPLCSICRRRHGAETTHACE